MSSLDTEEQSPIGIGRATAIALSVAGWSVVLTGRRLDQLQETEKSCASGSTLIVVGEVTDEEFVARLFKETVDKFGTCIDIFKWINHLRKIRTP
jgi:NADP-dependent 3-hydroxy acid dehydrogenase YdfG